MKVTLLNYTQDAKELLIFSKKTRLKMSPDSFAKIKNISEEQKQKELQYVFGTIGSSWEFVDYVFMIEKVSRVLTHQLIRHRVGVSYAQQAHRVINFSEGFEYLASGKCQELEEYHNCMIEIQKAYHKCIEKGANVQDIRGILPQHIFTNIMMKVNLRALSGILNVRLCYKVQDQMQDLAKALRQEVLAVHPWTEPILRVHCAQHGTCLFPGYKECPLKVKGLIPKVDTDAILTEWENTQHEVQPQEDKS